MDAASAIQLVLFREANLAAVAEGGAGDQVCFTEVGHIADRSGEAAGSACDVGGIADNGEPSLRILHRNGSGNGGIQVDVVAGFSDPVVLNVEYHRSIWPGLRSCHQCCGYGAAQVACYWAQGCVGVDGAEIGDDAAADVSAVTFPGSGAWLSRSGRMASAASDECNEQDCNGN